MGRKIRDLVQTLAKARNKEEVARIRQYVIEAVIRIQSERKNGTKVRKHMCTPQIVSNVKRAGVVLNISDSSQ